jgi:hypothetical protein
VNAVSSVSSWNLAAQLKRPNFESHKAKGPNESSISQVGGFKSEAHSGASQEQWSKIIRSGICSASASLPFSRNSEATIPAVSGSTSQYRLWFAKILSARN